MPFFFSILLSIKLCAIIWCLINQPINIFLKGGEANSRNSRCLLLLITSASTAVNLDHCDANLRRCSHPGEEAGSVCLIERGVGVWESEAENDECVRKTEPERERCLSLWLCAMMKQLGLPLWHKNQQIQALHIYNWKSFRSWLHVFTEAVDLILTIIFLTASKSLTDTWISLWR